MEKRERNILKLPSTCVYLNSLSLIHSLSVHLSLLPSLSPHIRTPLGDWLHPPPINTWHALRPTPLEKKSLFPSLFPYVSLGLHLYVVCVCATLLLVCRRKKQIQKLINCKKLTIKHLLNLSIKRSMAEFEGNDNNSHNEPILE